MQNFLKQTLSHLHQASSASKPIFFRNSLYNNLTPSQYLMNQAIMRRGFNLIEDEEPALI